MVDEERSARLFHHMYETNEGIAEQSERIVALEELVQDMWRLLAPTAVGGPAPLEGLCSRMRELGVEP